MLVIVDYGIGNLGSLLNMCKYTGVSALISGDPERILQSKHIILPGVGAFDQGIKGLIDSGLSDVLSHCVLEKKTPILGVCLGMQIMTNESEEGQKRGLGWIDAKVFRIPSSDGIKVPHMGWSRPHISGKSKLFSNHVKGARYYFVHSYCVSCTHELDSVARVNYGIDFDVAFEKDNIFGVQFHPEKSHDFGMKLITNFANC